MTDAWVSVRGRLTKKEVEIIDAFEHAPVVGEHPGEATGEGVLTVCKFERHVRVIVRTGDGDRHAISKVTGAGDVAASLFFQHQDPRFRNLSSSGKRTRWSRIDEHPFVASL